MPVLTNVFRRGGVFYFRARVPASLRVRVGRNELWRSLRTREPSVARRLGGILFSLTEVLWGDLECAMGQDEVQLLIDGWIKAKLDEDTEVRRVADPDRLAQHEAEQNDIFGGALWRKNTNDPTVAARHAEELLAAHGLSLAGAELDMATRLMMRAHYEFVRAFWSRETKQWRPWLDRDDPAAALVARLSSSPADTVAKAQPPLEVRGFGLLSEVAREAIADFARKDGWKPKRIADYETAVATLTSAFGRDPDLGEITPEVAGNFMRDLTHYPTNVTKRSPYKGLSSFHERVAAAVESNDERVLAPPTINGKYLTPLRRIYEWHRPVKRELTNPFQGLRAEKPRRADPRKKRRDFTASEVSRLFALPMFAGSQGSRGQSLYLPGQVKIDDWRVWVPLVCFFTGMRLNEACGLTVADIRQSEEGIEFIHVRDDEDGQSLKSAAARRKVPIHDALIEVGFLRFVERQRSVGAIRLFEDLQADASGYFSGKATKFFADLINRIEDAHPDNPGQLVFHSVRHSVATCLRVADTRIDVSKAIVGHEQDDVHGSYGDYPLAMLKDAVNKIAYPGLDLGAVVRP